MEPQYVLVVICSAVLIAAAVLSQKFRAMREAHKREKESRSKVHERIVTQLRPLLLEYKHESPSGVDQAKREQIWQAIQQVIALAENYEKGTIARICHEHPGSFASLYNYAMEHPIHKKNTP